VRQYKYLVFWLGILLLSFAVTAFMIVPSGSGGTDDQAAALAEHLGARVTEPLVSLGSTAETFMFTLGGFVSGILLYHFWLKVFGRGGSR